MTSRRGVAALDVNDTWSNISFHLCELFGEIWLFVLGFQDKNALISTAHRWCFQNSSSSSGSSSSSSKINSDNLVVDNRMPNKDIQSHSGNMFNKQHQTRQGL